eukprot:TRINITY_DN27572_c0_g1_i1.p2 TRINITY_DN27572_c0_g1~~TRINITY_DN27572_c0_g1_i1.p2  ORF type:complete len:158 (+),score=60.74 TRINITY_DN27572_c0_g1_i1:80-553(+)
MGRLLAVQGVVLFMLFMLGVAATVYGSLNPWCIHLRHVPDFENFWARYTHRGFYGVRDLAVYQGLLIVVGSWAACAACGIQTRHITGVKDMSDKPPQSAIPVWLAIAFNVALTFAALPIDSEDPFFEIGWGPRTIIILLIYFVQPFFRPKPQKIKAH